MVLELYQKVYIAKDSFYGSRGGYIFYRKDSGAQQPSSAMGSGAFHQSVKHPEREADHASI